jgi:hypothetical protein
MDYNKSETIQYCVLCICIAAVLIAAIYFNR